MAEWPKGEVARDDRLANGEVAPQGSHSKGKGTICDLERPRSIFRGCLTACGYHPRHQFLAEMPEAKVS